MGASYEGVVLLHDEDAGTALRLIEEKGPAAALAYLKSLEVPGEGTLIGSGEPPWKESDTVYEDGSGFVVYYDAAAPYVGLVQRIGAG